MDKINNENNDELNLREIISFFLRHKVLISVTVGLFFIGSLYFTLSTAPSYTATASIMIDEKQGSSLVFDFSSNSETKDLENEKILINSRVIAEDVIEKLWNSEHRNNLNVLGTRHYIPTGYKQKAYLKNLFSLGFIKEDTTKYKKVMHSENYNLDSLRMYTENIAGQIKIENSRKSKILFLSFSSPFPEEAALVLNTIIDVYINFDRKWGSNQISSSLSFIEEQSIKIEQELASAENKLKNFKESKGIFDLTGNSQSILNQLIETEGKFYNTKAEINILKQGIDYIKSKLSEQEQTLASKLTNSINSQLFALRAEISEKETEIEKNEIVYGDDHGLVLQAKNDIKALKVKLDDKVDKLIKQGLVLSDPVQYRQDLIEQLLLNESTLSSNEAKLSEYKILIDKYNNEINGLPSLQLNFARLERDRSVLNQTYMYMRQKLEETRIAFASESGKIKKIDEALIPIYKSSTRHSHNILYGMVLGLVFSLLISFLLERLNNTINSIDSIRKDLPILGLIPSILKKENKIFYIRLIDFLKSKFFMNGKQKDNRHLIAHDDPKSPISEAYRTIRTNLMYSSVGQQDNDCNTIVISSTGPGEGKTTTISNLAITYANLGKKVLLIDTDLRKPVLHHVFNLDRENGLTAYLTKSTSNIEKIVKNTHIKNLSVITSGLVPPNPSELISSKVMSDLINKLKEIYDVILFDSPPLIAVTDASIIAKYVDNMILVIMPGKTDKIGFNHCLSALEGMNSPIKGVVFNGIDANNSYGSYYYYYQYYKYYGESK